MKGRSYMEALISIRPEHVERILSGEKKYEFRKKIFKQPVSRIYIYASSPQKKIIGYFDWAGFLSGSVEDIWIKTREYAGIAEADYQRYFAGRDSAHTGETLYLNPAGADVFALYDT